jgi:hypothetical protein
MGLSAGLLLLYIPISRGRGIYFSFPIDLSSEFNDLSNEEKSFWLDFVTGIPSKLKAFRLFIRPYGRFCRTCLIPDCDIRENG